MKKYKISSKGFKALQWTGNNKEAVKSFINGEINFVFNENDVLTILSNENKISLLAGDYLMKRSDGNFFELEENVFLALFEEVKTLPINKTNEQEVAEAIWDRINDKVLFEDELSIVNRGRRVRWVLANEYADMCEEAPFFTSEVKKELRNIFKKNNAEV